MRYNTKMNTRRRVAATRDPIARAARTSARALLGAPRDAAAGTVDPLESRILMAASDVVINEIMYNSATAETADEYVELYNKGTTPVNIGGWKLASAVDYTFAANTTLNAGQYLVVAANTTRFAQKYPAVGNVVGNWVGQLSNSQDNVRLLNSSLQEMDQVHYADDGEWAQRRRGGEAYQAVGSITQAGGTATVNVPAHGYSAGNKIAIFGANQAGYDGIFTIGATNAGSFTINVPAGTPTTATGQIFVRRADFLHFGWDWFNLADGGGRSLELINPNLSNDRGQNWGASTVVNGTPGAANSIASGNIAPLIENLSHFPLVPKSTDVVTVTAKVDDEQTTGLTVQVFYRKDGAASFTAATMFDDGLHGDGSPFDGVYGANLPSQTDGTVVEFYVKATDAQNNSRTWPGPTDVTGEQLANALYQVDDAVYTANQPLFKLIMTESERAELDAIGNGGNNQQLSNAAMNGTFISLMGDGADVRYSVGIRNRGGGSRIASVSNYRVNFTNDHPWHNTVKLNLNATFSMSEVAGAALAARAGLPAQRVTAVQVRVNNANLATAGSTDGMYGSYSWVEAEDNDYAKNHFPTDSQGNLYSGVDGSHNANLTTGTYTPDRYPKQTNVEANDYSDLDALIAALNAATNTASYAPGILANVDLTEWARYFAFNVLSGNYETSLGTGYGDDFGLYRGTNDTRFKLTVHDLDSILTLGQNGSSGLPAINQSIFRATNLAVINKLLTFPDFAPVYFQQVQDLAQNVFTPTELSKVLHHALDGNPGGSYVSGSLIDAAVANATARADAALAQIPTKLNVTTAPAAGGYVTATNATQLAALSLGGSANALVTKSVTVNGRAATYTPWKGTWTITNAGNTLGLNNGMNRVIVRAYNAAAQEVGQTFVDVWYQSGAAGTTVSSNITTNTTWSPANGPYRITASVAVNSGATLTIQPGTSVYLADNARLTINGTLSAVGNNPNGTTTSGHIRFTHDPANHTTNTASWGGIVFTNTTTNNTLAYADVEFAGVGSPDTQVNSSKVDFDHDTWANVGSGQRIIDIVTVANFSLTNSIIGSLKQQENVHFVGATVTRALIQGNIFGTTTNNSPSAKNDIIDFTGGNRPGAIVQFLDNVFVGTGTTFGDGDDHLDLDGTDAHIEGNLFMNLGHSSTLDTNSAISGGADSGNTSEVVGVRNFFYNVDHGYLMKEGNSFTSANDTFANVITAPFNFSEPGFAPTPGLAGYADGDVFYQTPLNGAEAKLVDNPPTGSMVVRHSIMPGTTPYPGAGNLVGNPAFYSGVPTLANVNLLDPTLVGIALQLDPSIASHLQPVVDASGTALASTGLPGGLDLKPTSPGIDTGFNGADMGANVPKGATIAGAPAGTVAQNAATLTVGGPGIKAYQWKLDNGAVNTVNVTNPFTANAVISPIVLSGLANGSHTVSVWEINSAGVTQASPTTATWTVNTALGGHVRINEILADNATTLNNSGTTPDVIELYNDGNATVDLSDFSLSDDPTLPRKFVFPAGTTLAAGAYLTLYADSANTKPGTHLGFALSSTGDGVFLYNKLSAGGTLADSVTFGIQLTDYSIGRVGPTNAWALTTPTLGAANLAAPTGDPGALKINEWQASGAPPFNADFIELYNAGAQPAPLGGLYVTDNFTGWPTHHQIAPLSFIAPGGYTKLVADDDNTAGANHLSFQLNADRGEIALLDPAQQLIDYVFYGPQTSGISEGLSPNGSDTYRYFNLPTPGLPNGQSNQPAVLNLATVTDTWHYNLLDSYADQSWAQPGFIENNNWQPGGGLIYHETATLPWPKTTAIPDAEYVPGHLAYYFRRTFNLADPSTVLSLQIRALIDDGAIFYLNGHELTPRYNMPGGAVTPTTQASGVVGDATVIQEFTNISPQWLVAGQNTLAVEVHQNGTSSTDMVFGLEMDAIVDTNVISANPLRVTELMYNAPGDAANTGDEYEFVELQNTGNTPLNLTGVRFTGGIDFTFPNMTLPAGGRTVVVKNPTAFAARYGSAVPIAGQYSDSFDNTGETVRLETGTGALIQQFTYASAWYKSTDGGGDSLVINNPNADLATWDTAAGWHPSTADLGTPGTTESTLPTDAVVVNEVLANSTTGPNDWIELRNTTNAAVDVSGWYLSDSTADLLKFRIPNNTVIPANGFLVFSEGQTFGNVTMLGANAFSLSSTGDDVFLSSAAPAAPNALTGYRTSVHFGASDPGVTMGRYTNSVGKQKFVALAKPTKAAANSAPLVGPVVINEINYHPESTKDEFLELKNITSSAVSLDGWQLQDGVSFTFPAGTTLAAGAFLIVTPDSITPAEFRTKYGIPAAVQIVGGYTGGLSNGGDNVVLAKPVAPTPENPNPFVTVDEVDYETASPWPAAPDGNGPSLSRFVESAYGDDPANWRASTALNGTPGAANDSSPVTATGEFVELSANKLVFRFSKNVGPSIATADLQLTNLTTNTTIATGTMAVVYDSSANTATFTFPGQASGRLPTGRYRATLLASGVNASGVALDGNADGTPGDNYLFTFDHLPGDMNGDAKVDFADYQLFELNFGKTGATWANGDFDYNGVVNNADKKILLANLNKSLASSAVPATTVPETGGAPVTSAPPPTPTPKPTPAPKPVTPPVKRPTPVPRPTFATNRITKKKDESAVWS